MKILALTTLMLCFAGIAWGVVDRTTDTPAHDYRILVTRGVVTSRTMTLEGQDRAVPAVNITTAMNAQGKMVNSLQNRTLLVTGPLADEVLALRGREVVVRGIVRRGNILQVTWIQDKSEASRNIHAPTPVW